MKADTKRIAIHDESGLFVEEFVAKNSDKSYKYIDLSLIEAQFLKDSITNEITKVAFDDLIRLI
jgi:ABC-2 type transport system permease protein